MSLAEKLNAPPAVTQSRMAASNTIEYMFSDGETVFARVYRKPSTYLVVSTDVSQTHTLALSLCTGFPVKQI